MAKRKESKSSSCEPMKLSPALSPEANEQYLIYLSMKQAEKDLKEGKASSQVVTHFLKLATEKERLEKEKLRRENLVLEAKAKAYEQAENIQALYEDAINAMKGYAGLDNANED